MGSYYKKELFGKLMQMVNTSDGPELAYYYKVICQCDISEEEAHYQHEEIVTEIEIMASGFGEEELTGIMEILGQIEDEE